MLNIKWTGWKVPALEPVGNIKVNQLAMVEEFYRNKK